jgi:hypothetical protein
MMPNFEPKIILPRLGSLLREKDQLLLSANLAPGSDYTQGIQKILPLYDNPPTRAWLMTFLLDLGVAAADGELRFSVEAGPVRSGLKRVEARFYFRRARKIQVSSEDFKFKAGESIRLFSSYRHTPELINRLLSKHGLRPDAEWITTSQEEGVVLVRKSTPQPK